MFFKVLSLAYFLGLDYEEFREILDVCDNNLDAMYWYINPNLPE